MADPISSGASSQLQSHLAAQSGGGGQSTSGGVLTWIMSFGNVGGANILAPGQHFAGKMSLTAAFGWLGNSFGLKTMVGGDKLAKSPVGKPLSKTAKPLGASNFGLAGGGPSVAPPSLSSPKAPGGTGLGL
jgi:hypothetical protein